MEKYSKEEVIEQLKQHYLKNPKMTMMSFGKDKSVCSTQTVRTLFGSWNKALLEAGIKKEKEKTEKERVLKDLKKYYSKNKNINKKSFNRDRTVCSTVCVLKHFGSWDRALLEAGIYVRENKRMTREKIIEQLKDHYSRNPKITAVSFKEDKRVCAVTTVMHHFGSWNKALGEAGIREMNYVEYEKDKLLLILKEKVKTGELKYEVDIMKIKGIPSINYIKKIWSWKELVKKLGLKRVVGEYTQNELLELYKKVKKKYKNKKIALSLMKKETGISGAVFKKHFGSWNNFLRSVDEEIVEQVRTIHTNKELIKMYREFSIKIGREVYGASKKDIESAGFTYSSQVLARRFTGMLNLKRLAGFEIERNHPYKYSRELIKNILYEKYKEYGRKLTIEEIKKSPELPYLGTIYKHFQISKMNKIWEEVIEEGYRSVPMIGI